MSLIQKISSFANRWGWVALVAFASLVTWLLTRRNPAPKVVAEARAAWAEGEVEKMIEEQGRDRAISNIQAHYEEQKEHLRDDERAKAEKLKNDPVALARWLANIH